MPTEKEIRDRLVREVADATRTPADRIDVREPFASYDLQSIDAVYLVGELESWLGMPLDATLLWDHATIEALARHLATVVKDTAGGSSP